mgnify:CR=1 FL=1
MTVLALGRLVVEHFLVLLFRRFGLFVGLVRLRRVFWAIVLAPWLSACKFCEGFRVYASMLTLFRCCKKERFQ